METEHQNEKQVSLQNQTQSQIYAEIAAILRRSAANLSEQNAAVKGQAADGAALWTVNREIMHTAESIAQFRGKIAVFGSFNTGKSTLINAITGEAILPVNVVSHHGCRQIVSNALPPKQANVTYAPDKRVSMTTDSEDYREKFLIRRYSEASSPADETLRIKRVDYGCSGDFCSEGIEIHESAPIGSVNHVAEARELLASAHAAIFVLNATQIFNQEERAFLKELQMTENKQNIFVIISKMDLIGDAFEDVKQAVLYHLEPLFTDSEGALDRALFEERVFFLDGRTAFANRVEGKLEPPFSDFLTALRTHMQAASHTRYALKAAQLRLEDAMQSVQDQMEAEQAGLSMPMEILMQKAQLSEEALQRAEREAKQVKKSFTQTERIIQTKIYDDLWRYINEMERAWDADAAALNIQMGLRDMLKIAVTINPEKREALMAPVAELLQDYLTERLEAWAWQLETLISPETEELTQSLQKNAEIIWTDLKLASEVFTGHATAKYQHILGQPDPGQILISTIMIDPSMIITGAAAGGFGWSEFFKKTLVQYMITWTVFGFLTGGTAWVAFFMVEYIQLKLESDRMNETMQEKLKQRFFMGLKEQVSTNKGDLYARIHQMVQEKEAVYLGSVDALIAAERRQLQKIIRDRKNAETAREESKMHYERILDDLKAQLAALSNIAAENSFAKGVVDNA
jgi:signal recognition particle receptor subunit beta